MNEIISSAEHTPAHIKLAIMAKDARPSTIMQALPPAA